MTRVSKPRAPPSSRPSSDPIELNEKVSSLSSAPSEVLDFREAGVTGMPQAPRRGLSWRRRRSSCERPGRCSASVSEPSPPSMLACERMPISSMRSSPAPSCARMLFTPLCASPKRWVSAPRLRSMISPPSALIPACSSTTESAASVSCMCSAPSAKVASGSADSSRRFSRASNSTRLRACGVATTGLETRAAPRLPGRRDSDLERDMCPLNRNTDARGHVNTRPSARVRVCRRRTRRPDGGRSKLPDRRPP